MFWCNVEYTVKLSIKMVEDPKTFQGHRIAPRVKTRGYGHGYDLGQIDAGLDWTTV